MQRVCDLYIELLLFGCKSHFVFDISTSDKRKSLLIQYLYIVFHIPYIKIPPDRI